MTATRQISQWAGWVESNTRHPLTDGEARCIDVLCTIGRPYNLSLIDGGWSEAVCRSCKSYVDDDYELEAAPKRAPVEIGVGGIVVRLRNSLGTYDSADLTRLVLAAHEHAVRVEVSADTYLATDTDAVYNDGTHPTYAAACLTLRLSARTREGSWYERHPTIDEAIARGTIAP